MSDSTSFSDRLAEAIKKKNNAVCVGLDPRWSQLPSVIRRRVESIGQTPATGFRRFCFDIIDVVAPLVPVVKPQMAFFEQYGPAGMQALAEVIRYANEKELLVILDGKRNDIGSTAAAYASAYLGAGDRSPWGADALTVSPYLGEDSLQPFIDRCNQVQAGIFVLAKTSNPGSGFLQDIDVGGKTIAEKVADWIENVNLKNQGECGYGPVGAVVGGTYPEQLAEMRRRMPHTWILVPGYGAQGGRAEDVVDAFDSNGLGAIVNSSRNIIFAYENRRNASSDDWLAAVETATKDMIAALRGARVG
jgi:orotidine-5'-phosphate decarboxylase